MVTITPLLLMLRRRELLDLFRWPQVKETIAVLGLVAAATFTIFYQREFPVLFLFAPVENRRLFLDAGCDAVVTKPVEWDELAQAVRKLLDRPIKMKTGEPAPQQRALIAAGENDAEDASPVFDPTQIDVLSRDLGRETMRDLLTQCVATMDSHLSQIRHSTLAGDHVTAKRIAHDLKGVCAQFGATRASEIAKRIELELNDSAAIATLIGHLADSISGAGAKIREITVQI